MSKTIFPMSLNTNITISCTDNVELSRNYFRFEIDLELESENVTELGPWSVYSDLFIL